VLHVALQSTAKASAHAPKDERNKEQDHCDDENDFSETYRCSGDAAEPEQRRNQRDDEKGYHEVQHRLAPHNLWLRQSFGRQIVPRFGAVAPCGCAMIAPVNVDPVGQKPPSPLRLWNSFVRHGVYQYMQTSEVHMGVLSWLFGRVHPEDVAQIDSPATAFDKPSDVVDDTSLTLQQKKDALNTWEQDARQLMTASNEGMPGRQEGLERDDHHRMADVVRAKRALGEEPQKKPAH
jgi:hypothetical protein